MNEISSNYVAQSAADSHLETQEFLAFGSQGVKLDVCVHIFAFALFIFGSFWNIGTQF